MLVYYPYKGSITRVQWPGGDSTMLHYQMETDGKWKDLVSQTLMQFPTSVKDLWIDMSRFYQDASFLMMEGC
jgi:hypothetical protein